jgi:hypothetical protein
MVVWAIGQDLRFALRQMRRAPVFASTAMLTLALGIGANTGIFSLLNGFLRPLPVPSADRLVVIAAEMAGNDTGFRFRFSYPALNDYRAETAIFPTRSRSTRRIAGMTARGKTTQFVYHAVTGNFFTGLQLPPLLGRVFEPGEGNTTEAKRSSSSATSSGSGGSAAIRRSWARSSVSTGCPRG